MKRKVTCILACILVIATVIPSMALAASNAAILDKLMFNDLKKYDDALPTKGTKKTEKQINDLLKKIPNKPSGKGNTDYRYYLDFTRDTDDKPGSYYSWADVIKEWYKYNDKTKISFLYSEVRDIHLKFLGDRILCSIDKSEDTINYICYFWAKGAQTGNYYTWKKTETNNNVLKPLNFKLYPDATVLGEKCMVYSYEYKDDTYYRFVSKTTRQRIKLISVDNFLDEIRVKIYFEQKLVNMADSFFDPPKDVKFTPYKGD